MFSYVAKSLLNKTLRAFLRNYLENIELDSIDYGYGSSSTSSSTATAAGNKAADDSNCDAAGGGSSGWGVRLSNVKLREGMELVKLPGKHKRIITRKKKVKTKRDTKLCPNLDFVSTPIATNKATITPQVDDDSGGGNESRGLQHYPTIDVDDSDISFCEEHTMETTSSVSRRDSDNGYCSSNSTSPTEPNRLLCRLPSGNCMSASARESATYLHETESQTESVINAKGGKSCAQETADHNSKLFTSNRTLAHNSVDDESGSEDGSYTEMDDEVVIEEDLTLVVGAGGSIGTLNIRYIGRELHVTVEDAHLIIEAVPTTESSLNREKESSKSPQPKMKHEQTTVGDADSSSDTTDNKKPTIGEKIEKKSLIARCLSLIPHLFLRDCRLTLIFPEETGCNESNDDSCDDCTLLECGIDFLSVTSGDDFLDASHFDTEKKATNGAHPKLQPQSKLSMSMATDDSYSGACNFQSQINVFSRKRIRTGKGPDGGVWLKIQPPLGKNIPQYRSRQPNGPVWARKRYLDSSQSILLRCSGLDFQSRLLVDREDLVHDVSNAWSNEYDDYTMDSMLFGVDYVDPMSLTRHQIKAKMKKSQYLESEPQNDVDSNGIQSIPFASNCHWTAQRVHRTHCENSHIPLKDCYSCWSECVQNKSEPPSASVNRIRKGNMNEVMPLPGFVFCLSISDPLEVNVDLCSLQSLGYINSLFTAKNQAPCEEQGSNSSNTVGNESKKSGQLYATQSSTDFDEESFPSYMQPHTMYLSSLSVSNITIRVQAIRPTYEANYFQFRFWQFEGKSIHYEESQIDADEQFLRDATFHVGSIECRDFTGVCEKSLVSIAGYDDTNNAGSICRLGEVHLPCTAARVIGVSYLAPNDKRTSSSYAVHLRLIQSDLPSFDVSEKSVSTSRAGYIDIRIGLTDIDVDDNIIGDVSDATNDATSIIFPAQTTSNEIQVKEPKRDINWLCQVSMTGGSVVYTPHVRLKIPRSNFRMRMGPEGLSFETLLRGLSIEYGSYPSEKPTMPSIIPLCSLPETLRMHILLYLNDLSPLEEVLNVKVKQQPLFLRCHALNKLLSSLPSKETRSSRVSTRRNQLLDRLQSLETDSLEALLAMHMRSTTMK